MLEFEFNLMDILKVIKDKIKNVQPDDRPKGITAIISHIEIAEKYYEKGSSEKDENYFTDVVYRTNHAFEGILKEAYEVLGEKDASKTSPYEIENYLIQHSEFNDRVMHLFSNYRTNWRNPSTHDYQLFFSPQEAFLAIVTVTSFVNILVDQIVEKLSYISNLNKVSDYVKKKNLNPDYEKSFLDNCVNAFVHFSEYYQKNFVKLNELPAAEFMGLITGFLSSFDENWSIKTNQHIQVNDFRLYFDIFIQNGDDKMIVKVKRNVERYDVLSISAETMIEELKLNLEKTDIKNGLVFFTPTNTNQEIFRSASHGITNQVEVCEIFSMPKELIPITAAEDVNRP